MSNPPEASKLRELDAKDGGVWDEEEQVLHVLTPHMLTQAAGYLKYCYRRVGPVFFRGQARLHPSLYASLHRGISTDVGVKRRADTLAGFLRHCEERDAFLRNTPEYTFAPLLQHYGVRTKWLDLVDNVWIALWFACHDAHAHGQHGEYLYFDRRQRTYPYRDRPDYVYVLLVHSGPVEPVPDQPGVEKGEHAEVIDLRVAAPSVYLRPHAQHAVLLRRRGSDDYASYNLQDLVVGTLRVELGAALEWLGHGGLLSVRALFPPPHYDAGYSQLLERIAERNEALGAVQYICA